MTRLFKVTLDGVIYEQFIVRAETENSAYEIALETVLNNPSKYIGVIEEVEEIKVLERKEEEGR